jgi:hypothetical protein
VRAGSPSWEYVDVSGSCCELGRKELLFGVAWQVMKTNCLINLDRVAWFCTRAAHSLSLCGPVADVLGTVGRSPRILIRLRPAANGKRNLEGVLVRTTREQIMQIYAFNRKPKPWAAKIELVWGASGHDLQLALNAMNKSEPAVNGGARRELLHFCAMSGTMARPHSPRCWADLQTPRTNRSLGQIKWRKGNKMKRIVDTLRESWGPVRHRGSFIRLLPLRTSKSMAKPRTFLPFGMLAVIRNRCQPHDSATM